ncbi:MAG TPA: PfkB family carbohydrate kinase, partial [Puia sp.]|nr:PfkB family carbohydrate kinase [Puia sp.]
MAAIVTVTFHPCIDVNLTVPALLPDIKMLCSSVQRQPGGGGINVARAIHQLGGEAMAVYPAGGCTGTKLSKLLAAEGVVTAVLKMPGETRENIIIRDKATGL